MKKVYDRVVQYANRYKLTNTSTGAELGTFDFAEAPGTVSQEGTEIDAELFDGISADLAARPTTAQLTGGTVVPKYAESAKDVPEWAKSASKPSYTKSDVGLGNVDNTSDANKPVSTATRTALNAKVDKVSGKQLSTNDYTTAEKNKLAGIESGAEKNVQSDWNTTSSSSDSYILNKPSLYVHHIQLYTIGEMVPGETLYTINLQIINNSASEFNVNGIIDYLNKIKNNHLECSGAGVDDSAQAPRICVSLQHHTTSDFYVNMIDNTTDEYLSVANTTLGSWSVSDKVIKIL